MKIEEYAPLIKPTIKASAKSWIEPVVKRNNDTTANKVVTVVIIERLKVSDNEMFRMSANL